MVTSKFLQHILILVLVIATVACTNTKHRNNQISRIEIATGECYRHCPQIAISIDSLLAFKYYGGKNAKVKGYYTGNISPQLWDTLNIKLEAIQYKKLSFQGGLLDDQGIELIIHYQSKVAHIETTINYSSDSIKKVFNWLVNASNLVKLNPVKDTIKFETTLQYEGPPHPKLKQVEFPHPINNR